MASVEGESPNSEEPSAGKEEVLLSGSRPLDLDAMEETIAASLGEPVAAEGVEEEVKAEEEGETTTEQTEGEGPAEEEGGEEEEGEEQAPQEPSQMPAFMEWAAAIGVPLILLVLALLHLFSFTTAIYLIAVGFIPFGLWKYRDAVDVYSLLLACALAAVTTAVYFMCLEMGRYRFDLRAREAKQRVSMSQPPLPVWRQFS